MKLVTWNAQWCRGLDGVVNPERIVKDARRLADFDVLCLQEIAVHYPRLPGNAGHDQPALLRELLPGFQVFFGAAVDEWGKDGHRSQFGNLVATRLAVAQVQHHPLPYPAHGGMWSMPRMCTVVTMIDPGLGPVRVMTAHLEYFSEPQRVAQARALRELHLQACAHTAAPPKSNEDGSPFQTKVHTENAILCGDFNLESHQPGYRAITRPFAQGRLWDCWRLLNGRAPQPHTFRLHARKPGEKPMACDFVFVGESLKGRVRGLQIDSATQASDHQPLALELG
ncbi:MAG TPA: endonuclease/exonuclease/phosphatase family protein [Ramlibacter sp.]|jgi:endonuclease/exonuclease/phosphatase family metal-dependent hydrolase